MALERIFGLLSKIYLRGCEKCMLCVRTIFFMTYRFFEKKNKIFFFNKDLERNFFGLLKKNYRSDCEKYILHIHSNILMKIDFSWKTFSTLNISGHWPKNLWSLPEKFRRGWDHCILHLNWKFLTIFFHRKISKIFLKILDLEWKSFGNLSKNYREVVKTSFYLFIRTLRRLFFFQKKTINFDQIRTLSNFFKTLCWNFLCCVMPKRSCVDCILSVHTITLMKKILMKKLEFFHHFGTLRK